MKRKKTRKRTIKPNEKGKKERKNKAETPTRQRKTGKETTKDKPFIYLFFL